MFDSRVVVTHRIIRALNAVKTKPGLMISVSAAGYYPPGVEVDEYTRTRGDGFLADLCYAWEKEARRCPEPVRLVIARLGVVLSPDGGADAADVPAVTVCEDCRSRRARNTIFPLDRHAGFLPGHEILYRT